MFEYLGALPWGIQTRDVFCMAPVVHTYSNKTTMVFGVLNTSSAPNQ